MTDREAAICAWKTAKAELDEVERLREEAVEHLRERWVAAYEAEDLARDALPDRISDCETCGEPIFDGDPWFGGDEAYYLCASCAPKWEDMKKNPGDFCDTEASDEAGEMIPFTHETAKPIIEKHLASGGSLSDSMASAS